MASGVEPFIALAKSAAEKLRFPSGQGGYAVNVKRAYPSDTPGARIHMISRRFEGVDIGRALFFSKVLVGSDHEREQWLARFDT